MERLVNHFRKNQLSHLFVTAASTDIGKTYITGKFLEQDQKSAQRWIGSKPIVSGWDAENLARNDTGKLLKAMKIPLTPKSIDSMTPWRYHTPVAPDLAQRIESKPFCFDELQHFCNLQKRRAEAQKKSVIFEGVGGILSPISQNKTVLDWIKAIHVPSLVVAGTYLGSISHTLSCLQVLERDGILIRGVVLNETKGSAVSIYETERSLKQFMSYPVFKVYYQDPFPNDIAKLYQWLNPK